MEDMLMIYSPLIINLLKTILFILISFIAVSTLLIGIILMSVPDGSILQFPMTILKDSPFKDFRLPGFLLFILVGGVNIIAVYYNMISDARRYNWAIAGSVIVILWSLTQYFLLETSFVIDMFYLFLSISIILISMQLKGKSLI